jgi:hypothetical protein
MYGEVMHDLVVCEESANHCSGIGNGLVPTANVQGFGGSEWSKASYTLK